MTAPEIALQLEDEAKRLLEIVAILRGIEVDKITIQYKSKKAI